MPFAEKGYPYGDSLTKTELLSSIQNDFTAAKLVLNDPLTRKRFNIKDGDTLHSLAVGTAERHILGEERREKDKSKTSAIAAIDQYAASCMQVI